MFAVLYQCDSCFRGYDPRVNAIHARLARIAFDSGPFIAFESMSPNAREIFGRFVWRYCAEQVTRERWKRRAKGRL